MWARPPCSGVFSVGNLSQNMSQAPTLCGYGNKSLASKEVGAPADSQVCKRGATGQASSHCGLMLLTSYFTTVKDWQRGETARADVSQLGHFYTSAMRLGLNVTVIYDELPRAFIGALETSIFRFHKVTVAPEDKKVGVNDVRYGFFQELVRRHPEWSAVFTVDLFDVTMGMNPCPDLRPGMLYVGVENAKLAGNSWMRSRFKQMGGKYMEWYNTSVSSTMAILNCGIIGGLRETMLSFFEAFDEILRDSTLAVRQRGEQINVNMAVLNYIGHTKFAGKFQGKDPVHSKYKSYQHKRTDVWFIHK